MNSPLTMEKVTYSLSNKSSWKDDLSLLSLNLLIKKHKAEKVKSIKFFGILLDDDNLGLIILIILKDDIKDHKDDIKEDIKGDLKKYLKRWSSSLIT